MLESYLRNRLKEKKILLMTHIVLGYPSFKASYEIIAAMVDAGVDVMEMQNLLHVIVQFIHLAMERGEALQKLYVQEAVKMTKFVL